MADKPPDKADQHKTEILNATHDFYLGKIDGGEASDKLREVFTEALKDGSAEDLYKKLQSTPYGRPNVSMHREGNKEFLQITAGFWEWSEWRAQFRFDVEADAKQKSVNMHTWKPTWQLPSFRRDAF